MSSPSYKAVMIRMEGLLAQAEGKAQTSAHYQAKAQDNADKYRVQVAEKDAVLDRIENWFDKHASSLSVEAVLDFDEAMGWIPSEDSENS